METEKVQPRDLHKAASRSKDDDCDGCFYCGMPFGRFHHEHDHAPVPKNKGGERVVPACPTCHDLKDRYGFHNWSASALVLALQELFSRNLLTDFAPEDSSLTDQYPTEFPNEWSDMSSYARIAWAKMARLAHTEPSEVPQMDYLRAHVDA